MINKTKLGWQSININEVISNVEKVNNFGNGFSTDLLNYSLIFARWAHWFLNLIRVTNVDKTYLLRVLKVPKSIFKFGVDYNRGLKVCVKKFILGERERGNLWK